MRWLKKQNPDHYVIHQRHIMSHDRESRSPWHFFYPSPLLDSDHHQLSSYWLTGSLTRLSHGSLRTLRKFSTLRVSVSSLGLPIWLVLSGNRLVYLGWPPQPLFLVLRRTILGLRLFHKVWSCWAAHHCVGLSNILCGRFCWAAHHRCRALAVDLGSSA